MEGSDALVWFAKKQPTPTRWLLRFACEGLFRLFPGARPEKHWTLRRIANEVGYRIPGYATLGNGMKIRIPRNDGVGQIVLGGDYHESETVDLLKSMLGPGTVFMDAGAHVGQYTLVASHLVGPQGAVHSFEPDPETFRWLSYNVRLNRLRNVSLNQAAMSSSAEKKLFFPGTPEGMASGSLAMHGEFSGQSCEVACTTVDTYVQSKSIRSIDLIKIDVEGAELDMLQGARALLARDDRPLLIVEFEEGLQKACGKSCAQLADYLKSAGYSLFRAGPPPLEEYAPRADDPSSFNVIAVPAARKAQLAPVLRPSEH